MVYVQDTGIVKVTWYRRKFARIPQFVKSKVAHNDRYQKLLRLNVSGQKQIRSHLVIDRRSEIEFVFCPETSILLSNNYNSFWYRPIPEGRAGECGTSPQHVSNIFRSDRLCPLKTKKTKNIFIYNYNKRSVN